ncbi:hypothetical protein RDI58_017639 [Solanum bulbocastanum]|uniref:Uncharacterized protein n=1 Tax=Solanum bulbocastanum TaxID=147425 RepID=A0AAN8TBN8_SOLBU
MVEELLKEVALWT